MNREIYSEWVLVETQLDRYAKHNHIHLLGRDASNHIIIDTTFPVLQNGRVHELVRLPDGITGLILSLPGGETLQDSKFVIRRVATFERVWRMANRVIRAFNRLSGEQPAGFHCVSQNQTFHLLSTCESLMD